MEHTEVEHTEVGVSEIKQVISFLYETGMFYKGSTAVGQLTAKKFIYLMT